MRSSHLSPTVISPVLWHLTSASGNIDAAVALLNKGADVAGSYDPDGNLQKLDALHGVSKG